MQRRLYVLSQRFSKDAVSFQRQMLFLCRAAVKEGYKVTVLASQENPNEPQKETIEGIKVIRFSEKKWPALGMVLSAVSRARRIKKYLSKEKITKTDLIYANGEAAMGALGYKYVVRAGDLPSRLFFNNMSILPQNRKPHVWLARMLHMHMQKILERAYLKNAAAITFSSEENKRIFEEEYHCTGKSTFIPRSGVEILKNTVRKSNSTTFTLFFYAPANELLRKGATIIENVLSGFMKKFPQVRLCHVGGNYSWNVPKDCEAKIIAKGKLSHEKARQVLASCDLVLHPSLSEGFPTNTILEGMGSGVPVLTSDIQGVSEWVVDKKTGYICKRGNAESLKQALEWAIEHSKERQECARNALRNVLLLESKTFSKDLLNFISLSTQKKTRITVNILKKFKH